MLDLGYWVTALDRGDASLDQLLGHPDFPSHLAHDFACDQVELLFLAEREAGREPEARCWRVLLEKRDWVAKRAHRRRGKRYVTVEIQDFAMLDSLATERIPERLHLLSCVSLYQLSQVGWGRKGNEQIIKLLRQTCRYAYWKAELPNDAWDLRRKAFQDSWRHLHKEMARILERYLLHQQMLVCSLRRYLVKKEEQLNYQQQRLEDALF